MTVHWDKVERDLAAVFDRDGDGKLGQKDLEFWQRKVGRTDKFADLCPVISKNDRAQKGKDRAEKLVVQVYKERNSAPVIFVV